VNVTFRIRIRLRGDRGVTMEKVGRAPVVNVGVGYEIGDVTVNIGRTVIHLDSGWATLECEPVVMVGDIEYRSAVRRYAAAGFKEVDKPTDSG